MSEIKTAEEILIEALGALQYDDLYIFQKKQLIWAAQQFHEQFKVSNEEINAAAIAHGIKIIAGKIPWQQEQVGSKTASFTDGAKWATDKIFPK